MTTFEESSKLLQDAFYQLSLSGEKPDATILDELVRRYPEHGEALTAFAIDLALDATVAQDDEVGDDSQHDLAISRAMSRFHNRVYELKQADRELHASPDSSAINPFSSLDRAGFRALAKRLNVSTVFLQKVRDRVIDEGTVPNRFCERLRTELGISLDAVTAHLHAPAQISPAYYKSDQKPEAGPKQTFEQAVKTSGLTAEQQTYLLSL